jgi:hypothetical protein
MSDHKPETNARAGRGACPVPNLPPGFLSAALVGGQIEITSPLFLAALDATLARVDPEAERRNPAFRDAVQRMRRVSEQIHRRRGARLHATRAPRRPSGRAPRVRTNHRARRPRRTSRETRAGPDDGDSEPPGALTPRAGRHTAEAAA